jgi:tetratricopeptide (TPR) repeat protein
MPPPLAEPAAQPLVNEVCRRLNDPADKLDPFTLRRYQRDLQAALRDAPSEIRGSLYGTIGTILHRLGEDGPALDAYRNAARWQPGAADHENNIAAILLARGQLDEGLKHLARAQAIASGDSWMRVALACTEAKVRRELGEHAAARIAFERAVSAVDPSEKTMYLRLALSASELDYENDAVELFARYLATSAAYDRPSDESALEVIRRHHAEAARVLDLWPTLAVLVQRMSAKWDAPTPGEHEIRTNIELAAEAWAELCHLAQLAPDKV